MIQPISLLNLEQKIWLELIMNHKERKTSVIELNLKRQW